MSSLFNGASQISVCCTTREQEQNPSSRLKRRARERVRDRETQRERAHFGTQDHTQPVPTSLRPLAEEGSPLVRDEKKEKGKRQ